MKIGDRIELISMENDPCPIRAGARGTIVGINNTPFGDDKQIVVDWDNGRSLMLIYPEDKFKILPTDEEILNSIKAVSDAVKKAK